MRVIYDAGLLIAAERNDRAVWADHRARLELGLVPESTAPVVAQVSRGPRQVSLRRLLRGCQIQPLEAAVAHRVGALLRTAGTDDVVDAHVALVASGSGTAEIWTSDPEDLSRLAEAVGGQVTIRPV